MARTAAAQQRTVAGYSEREAINIAYSICYWWYSERGNTRPTHSDIDIRLCEERYNSPVAAKVFEWLQSHDTFSTEGERRYRLTKRVYAAIIRKYA